MINTSRLSVEPGQVHMEVLNVYVIDEEDVA
jgi:hypothetical protein